MTLHLDDIEFAYPGGPPVFSGVSLSVPAGSIAGLVAPSGHGKSTLLKIAALTLAPGRGSVSLDGEAVAGVGFAVPAPVRRRIGLVFQSPRAATGPRLKLRRIIAEPLSFRSGRRTPRPDDHTDRVAELADLVQLTGDLLDRYPHQVSDGQLQRACVARALALEPDVLLCDEPTAMLDAPTTAAIMRVVAGRAEAGAAVLIASHQAGLLRAVGADLHELVGGQATW